VWLAAFPWAGLHRLGTNKDLLDYVLVLPVSLREHIRMA
jgi:hypothetical protein